MKNKTFVLGDLHGGHKALLQVLERASFDYKKDTLISLGDVADGWTEIVECFEEFFKIKKLIMVRGNHDQWLLNWMETRESPYVWVSQGGENTLNSYGKHPKEIMDKHRNFLRKTPFYYIDKKNRLFVHGGLEIGVSIEKQDPEVLMWDRGLVREDANVPEYKEVYVGHTTVWRMGGGLPVRYGNVVFMDTGGGWEGKLSLMNIDSGEVFQSDRVEDLYPGVHPR